MKNDPTSIDLVCVGEVLADFVPTGIGAQYTARLGGAPANVAIVAASLGLQSALISRVGADWLGSMIQADLERKGVDAHLVICPANTGIAIVAPPNTGPPDFLMYRNGTADSEISLDNGERELIARTRVLHLSSLLATTATGRRCALEAATIVRDAGGMVSYDVNLRPTGWESGDAMTASAEEMIALADIVKVTEAELVDLGLEVTLTSADGHVWLITDGPRGARLVSDSWEVQERAPSVPVVDTTGAGDAALAALLAALRSENMALADLSIESARTVLASAVDVGSQVVQYEGATDTLPGQKL